MSKAQEGMRIGLLNPVVYAALLVEASEALTQHRIWLKGKNKVSCLETGLRCLYEAETIIELLEVNNCGSVGGFAKGQPYTPGDLQNRLDWLKKHKPVERKPAH